MPGHARHRDSAGHTGSFGRHGSGAFMRKARRKGKTSNLLGALLLLLVLVVVAVIWGTLHSYSGRKSWYDMPQLPGDPVEVDDS